MRRIDEKRRYPYAEASIGCYGDLVSRPHVTVGLAPWESNSRDYTKWPSLLPGSGLRVTSRIWGADTFGAWTTFCSLILLSRFVAAPDTQTDPTAVAAGPGKVERTITRWRGHPGKLAADPAKAGPPYPAAMWSSTRAGGPEPFRGPQRPVTVTFRGR